MQSGLKGARATANVRATVDAELKQTPLAEEHVALGARMVPFAGYRMPVQYEGIKAEHEAVRTRAGLFDVSHMGELLLEGPGAIATADYLVTNDVTRLTDGQALYTLCCDERGAILDDLIVYRQGPERVLIVCNAGNHAKIAPHVAEVAEGRCRFTDLSEDTALLALQGPKAAAILASMPGGEPATQLASFHLGSFEVAGVACTVARTGYTGEDGFELFCPSEHAVTLWRAILETGRPFGLAPAGLGCRDTLRLEAKLPLYGNDIDETTGAFEAGLGWVVKLDAGDFLGKGALAEQKARGVARKLVGIEMTGKGIARHGHPVVHGGRTVGVVTSGSPGPTVNKNIGLAYVPTELAAIGTQLGVEIRGKVIDAVVVKTPFYKRPATTTK
jgi:aminomethyltransferase